MSDSNGAGGPTRRRPARPRPSAPTKIIIVKKKASPTAIVIGIATSVVGLLAVAVFAYMVLGGGAKTPGEVTGAATSAQVVRAEWRHIAEIKGELQVIAFDPGRSERRYLGTQGQGVMLSENGGKTWRTIGLTDTTVMDISVDPRDTKTLIAASSTGVMASKDRGGNWSAAPGLPSGDFHVAQFDPKESQTVWAARWTRGAGGSTIFVSRDGGRSWVAPAGGPQDGDINFVSTDSKTGQTYVGSYGKGLFRTSNAGRDWESLNSGLPTDTDITTITYPEDRSVMYVGTHDYGVFRSLDDGKSWEHANNGKEAANDVHGLVAHPKDPETIFAAGMMMGKGIFVSRDKGSSWQPLETGEINLDDVHVFTRTPDGTRIIMGAGEHGGDPHGDLYQLGL